MFAAIQKPSRVTRIKPAEEDKSLRRDLPIYVLDFYFFKICIGTLLFPLKKSIFLFKLESLKNFCGDCHSRDVLTDAAREVSLAGESYYRWPQLA